MAGPITTGLAALMTAAHEIHFLDTGASRAGSRKKRQVLLPRNRLPEFRYQGVVVLLERQVPCRRF
jgi:hypothetical protein